MTRGKVNMLVIMVAFIILGFGGLWYATVYSAKPESEMATVEEVSAIEELQKCEASKETCNNLLHRCMKLAGEK